MKLDPQLYEEVEPDPKALGKALAVVALSSIATVAGLTGRLALPDVPAVLVLGLGAWAGWSAIAFLVGAQVCPEPQTAIGENSCEQPALRRT